MNNLVVTCFYLIEPKPGRSHDLYKQWFHNLLNCLNTEIIVFTDKKSEYFLNIQHQKIIYNIISFEELYYLKNYGISFWKNQEKKDPNKTRSWKLSVLYNEKCQFIQKAITLFPNKKRYIWCDFGCFRGESKFNFPVVSHLDLNKITLLQLKRFKKRELHKNFIFHSEKFVRIGGGVQVATKEIWLKWIALYDKTFAIYIKKSSVNCDQGLLATITIENRELVNLIKAKKTKTTSDKWFYLLEFCSDAYKNRPFWNFFKR